MTRNAWNFLVDILTYALAVVLLSTGLLMAYRLPPGSGGRAILGYTRHEWGTVHFWAAMAFLVLVVIHLFLHWRWVVCMFGAVLGSRSAEGRGSLRGLILMILLGIATALLVALPWVLQVEEGQGGGGGGGHGPRYRGGRQSQQEPQPALPSPRTP